MNTTAVLDGRVDHPQRRRTVGGGSYRRLLATSFPWIAMMLTWWASWVGSTFRSNPTTALAMAIMSAIVAMIAAGRTSSMSGVALALCEPRSISIRPLRWLLAVAPPATAIALRVSAARGDAFAVALDVLSHACVAIVAVLWWFNPRRGSVAMVPAAMTGTILAMTAGGVSPLPIGQANGAAVTILLFSLAAWWTSGWLSFASASPTERPAAEPGGPSPLPTSSATVETYAVPIQRSSGIASTAGGWTIAAIGLLAVVGWIGTAGVDRVLPFLRSRLQSQVTQTMSNVDSSYQIGLGQYITSGRIGSIAQQLRQSPMTPMLKVRCEVPPGYMRGDVFTRYADGHWNRRSRSRGTGYRLEASPQRSNDGTNRRRFQWRVDGDGRRPIAMTVIPFPEKGTRIFTPPNVREIVATAGRTIRVTADDLVVSGDISNRDPIDLQVTPIDPVTQNSAEQSHYLWVPQDLRRQLETYARSIRSPRRLPENASPREMAEVIRQHFRTQYRYSLETESIGGGDPIEQFLQQRPAGHCEYFATATALLLRVLGVPTRYVTGYAVDTETDTDDEWLARNRDAHAWVEAYDARSRRWFIVESTPGESVQPIAPVADDDMQSDSGGAFDDGEATGIWAAMMRVWSDNSPLGFIAAHSNIAWTFALSGIAWLWYSNRVRTTDRPRWRQRRVIERRIRRKTGLVRSPGETLHRFAGRVADVAAGADPKRARELAAMARWIRRHAVSIYRPGV